MAYIYAELNQKDKALLHLKAVLNNYPDDNTRSLALSNLTKLYIDQAQVNEAKETLNECLSLVYKLEDEEGIVYCEYLNAKLHILEKITNWPANPSRRSSRTSTPSAIITWASRTNISLY